MTKSSGYVRIPETSVTISRRADQKDFGPHCVSITMSYMGKVSFITNDASWFVCCCVIFLSRSEACLILKITKVTVTPESMLRLVVTKVRQLSAYTKTCQKGKSCDFKVPEGQTVMEPFFSNC